MLFNCIIFVLLIDFYFICYFYFLLLLFWFCCTWFLIKVSAKLINVNDATMCVYSLRTKKVQAVTGVAPFQKV